MRMFIGSDVHGSEANLIRFFTRVDASLADDKDTKVILLGDIYNHGPRNPFPEGYAPMRVAKLLNDAMSFITVIKGNCDSEVDQMVLEFPMLAEYAFLAADGLKIFATHGHNYGPGNPPPLEAGDFLLCGHTHLPVRRDSGGFTYLNPGSLSLPKEGTPHSYMTLEGGVFTWHDLFTGETFEPLR